MPLGTRVWRLGQILLLAGALGLTFLVFFGIAMRAALKAREVRVPGLVGIVMSNYATPQHLKASADAGAEFFLDKSSDFERITEILSSIAGHNHQTGAS